MKWQPIETAPKDGTMIDLLVRVTFKGAPAIVARITDCFWFDAAWQATEESYGGVVDCDFGNGRVRKATHWMPIPAPPVE